MLPSIAYLGSIPAGNEPLAQVALAPTAQLKPAGVSVKFFFTTSVASVDITAV
jgi:hypothetical protein